MAQRDRWVIVGSESLLGRELRDVLSHRRWPGHVKLLGMEESVAVLSDEQEEAAVIAPLAPQEFEGASVVFLAGNRATSLRTRELLSASGNRPVLIDLSAGLEERPEALLRMPLVEPESFRARREAIHVIAHPAAQALALFLTRMQRHCPARAAVAQIFEPASERGHRGLDELQQQTVALLSFKPLNKQVFDEQAGFNLLASYGSEAPEALSGIEQRIDRHLATLLERAGSGPLPSLRLLQAPVFHGHILSLWVEFEDSPGSPVALGEALACRDIEVRQPGEPPPSNAGIAGSSGITVGAVELDRNNPRAAWFWIAADNLRLPAESAVDVAAQLSGAGA